MTSSADPARRAWILVFAATALVAAAVAPSGGAPGAALRAIGWFWLMVLPGLGVYRLAAGRDSVAAAMSSLLLSPVILACMSILGQMAGLGVRAIAAVVILAGLAMVLAAEFRGARIERGRVRDLLPLAGLVVVASFLTGFLPMTSEWWRIRSDAWFHGAVVAQIRTFGVPPDDPYFVGMPLQYMWFYHALVLEIADALRMDPFRVMAIANIQAVAGLALAAYSLAGVFRERVVHRVTAAATLLFCFNGAFWILLPVKLVKAMMGDVRGGEEIARTFSLVPFNYGTACSFMNIYFNQEFFLDKFMVATAFGFALAFMTAGWFAAAHFLARRERSSLWVLAIALVGMLGFHSLVGFVMLVGIFGGIILALLTGRGLPGQRPRDAFVVLAVSLLCFLLMTPYLYQVMHMKEHEQVVPISFSVAKTAGIFISSALVLVLAWRQRWFTTERTTAGRVFAFGALCVTLFCLSIKLPGPNTYDKLGYFVFLPLSIIGGFTIADSILARTGRRRVAAAAVWTLLFALPVNGLAFAACFRTPTETVVTAPEARLSAWVREYTARDALFIDQADRVFLVVTGPRRYLFGSWPYAQQWGYPRLEMARRLHTLNVLYQNGPLDAVALEELSSRREALYVVVRPQDVIAGAAVATHGALFTPVFQDPEISLYAVNADACRAAIADAPAPPSPEELIRESRL
ncbi:MAG TPA: hypothetical protein VFX92_05065 [Candidatus Krumholzibacteria bacterium]|nr:hypothetical protein [Candidatus Krumholzibacteria bacterium]